MNELEYSRFCEFIDTTLNETMTIEDYILVLDSLDIPHYGNRVKGACHNDLNELESAKYNVAFDVNKRSYYCHVCERGFNLLSFVHETFKVRHEEQNKVQCMKYICQVCDIPFNFNDDKPVKKKYNWKYLKKYVKKEDEEIEDIIYDESYLDMFEEIYCKEWVDDYISIETMKQYGIKFYKYQDAIIIPCRNVNEELVGIRGRFLNPNSEHKYCPIRLLDGTQFNFYTNNHLYGLWITKTSISKHKKVVLGEAEKFTMQCNTFFGEDNFSVSLYGKAMSEIKKMLLLQLGITEVIIAIDFDYTDTHVKDDDGNYVLDGNGDYIKTEKFEKFIERLYKIGGYFKSFCKVAALISYGGHDYKMSPTDKGKEFYKKLYNEREELY